MPKRRRSVTTVIVDQVSSAELTKRGSSNSLNVQVRRGKDLLRESGYGAWKCAVVAERQHNQRSDEILAGFRQTSGESNEEEVGIGIPNCDLAETFG